MLGIWKDESGITVELQPRFGGPYYSWLKITVPLRLFEGRYFEYGVSFSMNGWPSNWTVWIHKSWSVSPWDLARVIRTAKRVIQ